MKKYYLLPIILIIMGFLLGINVAVAQYPHPGYHESTPTQSAAGGATVQSTTTVISNPAVMNPTYSDISTPPAEPPPKVAGTAEVGFQSLYSHHMQLYNIPLSYAFTDSFKISLTVPYVSKKLKGEYTGEEL